MKRVIVTGGLGFIGSHLVRGLLEYHRDLKIMVLDADTYAAQGYLEGTDHSRVVTEKVDIRSRAQIRAAFDAFDPEHIFHLAAESHVCRSIAGPEDFMTTNIMGTFNLLEEWRELRERRCEEARADSEAAHLGGYAVPAMRFMHVSTDEVFGDLGIPGGKGKANSAMRFNEMDAYDPRSPYAASKAASDHIAKAYHHTYGLDVIVTNCSNNHGPNQSDDKLIPRTIKAILAGDSVIVHGAGDHRRDWISVEDHVDALAYLFDHGRAGESYCIGGDDECSNLEKIRQVFAHMKSQLRNDKLELSLKHADDRPTDDERYAIDSSKLRALGWLPTADPVSALGATVKWYLQKAGCV